MTSRTDDDDDRLDSLGIPAGERSLVSPGTGRHRIEFILRVLAIVRSAQDLRAVGEPESSRLLDAQLDYYRSAHRLLNIHGHIVRCERDSGFSTFQPVRRADCR